MINAPFGEVFVRKATVNDAQGLSDMHAAAFRRGWSDAEIEALISQDNVTGLIADWRRALGRRRHGAGFLIYRTAADEAEILTIAVVPAFRRRGVGGRLLDEALRALYREGIARLYLEVEEGNRPAIRLYENRGFGRASTRPGYYAQSRATPQGALVMSRQVR